MPAVGVQALSNEAALQLVPKLLDLVTAPAQALWRELAARAPAIASAIALLLVLWVVARVARSLTARVLKTIRLDAALEGTFFGRILSGAAEGLTPSKALAYVVYLAILLVALSAASEQLGLTSIRAALASVLSYLPRVASGILTLAIGGYVAGAAGKAVGSTLKELKSPYGGMAQSATEAVILLITVTVAVNSLGADLSFITNNLSLIFGVIAVTCAFLFCWSMRRPAEEIIANYYLRRLIRVGDLITVADVQGTVEKFVALGLLLRDDEGVEHFIPAHHVLAGLRREGNPQAGSPRG
jgi:hypothetical protein